MALPLIDLRRRLGEALGAEAERAYALRKHDAPPADDRNPTLDHAAHRASENTRLLGLLVAGASTPGAAAVPFDAAGYGSWVALYDLDHGERSTHRLMHAEAMDLDAGHVSLESPLGSALLGRVVGDVVSVTTPAGSRQFRVEEVHTLPRWLEELYTPVRSITSARRTRTPGPANRRVATRT